MKFLDALLTNAVVLTMDPGRPRASSIGIWNGQIVGLDEELAGLSARTTVDLGGATVLPGFHDAHCHTTSFGLGLELLDLSGSPSIDAILAAVSARAAGLAPDAWVIGMGYGAGLAPGEYPHADQLDRAAGGRPVWLTHLSGHMCVVSTSALALIGLAGELPPVPRGRVVVDGQGHPTGLIEETAMDLVKDFHGPASIEQLARAIDLGTRQYAAEGITSFTDAGIGVPGIDHSPVEIAAYQRARQTGRLRARAQLMVHSEMLHALSAHPDDAIDLGLDLGLHSGFGDSWLEVGAVKVWVDGSGVAQTAATSDNDGLEEFDNHPDVLSDIIIRAHRAGWQVACHAMGDRALDLVLDALEAAQGAGSVPAQARPPRHRIEHGGLIRPDQIPRLVRLGLVVVPQPVFIPEFGDVLIHTLCGGTRTDESLRVRSLLAAGLQVAGSSDRPVAAGAPLVGIQAMVERRTANGVIYGPDERVPVELALDTYTRGGAYAAHAEHRRGTLTSRREADLVVLAEDPTAVEISRIGGIDVLATLVGGVATHDQARLFEEIAPPHGPTTAGGQRR